MATTSEELTAKLCGKTFLRMWSYPHVFRDQGRTSNAADGKELCDLLVVCGSDIIIFSVKECRYKDTGRPAVDWPRWYDRAIRRSAKQIAGAERWLRQFPKQLFLDKGCQTPFPFELPVGDDVRVHRVVVALGSREACAAYRGGNAALRIYPILQADDHVNAEVAAVIAFAVGNVAPDLGFVHVLDDVSLEIVLGELDTITDFTEYLRKKEALIESGKLFYAASEADLLAVYSTHMNDDEQHDFPAGDTPEERVAAEDGAWHKFRGSKGWERRCKANARSYLWDHIIDKFAGNALAGTLVGDPPELAVIEQAVRAMAIERRVNRRVLANALERFWLSTSALSAHLIGSAH